MGDELKNELLEIVTSVRAHLEYLKALGITHIEAGRDKSTQPASSPAAKRTEPRVESAEPIPLPVSPISPELAAIRDEIGDCRRCKLSNGRTHIVFGEGNSNAVLVFIGEGPGYDEDLQGRPFVGAAGQILTNIIEKGMKLRRDDVYICNIVKCRPPNNRNPEPDEIAACGPFLLKQLEVIKPKFIVALGNVAVKTLLKTTDGITKLRGKWQTFQGIPLMPTFHPAYLLRNPKDKALVWKDIQLVMAEMEKVQKKE